jgi:hypothetical protein
LRLGAWCGAARWSGFDLLARERDHGEDDREGDADAER